MPKIEWGKLPPAIRQHLYDRAGEREVPAEGLARLLAWRKSDPDVPDGPWYKDFGTFKLCGEGRYPKTFLTPGQAARGKRIE
jgi:hypothetical protein